MPTVNTPAGCLWLATTTSSQSRPRSRVRIVSEVVVVGQGQTQVDFNLRWLEPCVSALPAALVVDVVQGTEETSGSRHPERRRGKRKL